MVNLITQVGTGEQKKNRKQVFHWNGNELNEADDCLYIVQSTVEHCKGRYMIMMM
jgi:hypothetical protein